MTSFLQLLLKLESRLQQMLPSTEITAWESEETNINCQKIMIKSNKEIPSLLKLCISQQKY